MILGGAALTRAYVEQDLAEIYEGEVRYARDAFEGLRLMDALDRRQARRARRRRCPTLRQRRVERRAGRSPSRRRPRRCRPAPTSPPTTPCPTPPFWGTRVVKGIPLRRLRLLARRAGRCSWASGASSRPAAATGRRYEELVETEGRPRLRVLAGPAADREPARGRRRLRLLPVRVQGRRPDHPATRTATSAPASPSRASAAAGTCAWPTSSGREESGETDVRRPPGGHGRPADRRGHRRAVRRRRLPRLPGAARAVGAAGRGAGRVLARAGPRRARLRAARTRPTSRTCST